MMKDVEIIKMCRQFVAGLVWQYGARAFPQNCLAKLESITRKKLAEFTEDEKEKFNWPLFFNIGMLEIEME
ncbi:hypothetical protein RG959_21160 [Domibacillus sp. 8LH]|uniref:hypothetical protein n=1 Tax=Domibacillus TaxID=1433999 RepID=UPI00203ED510|nr:MULTISPECIES: hypothetical protein [Domibacillus]MCM3787454.1 hypothetical protein [Domibacillus indicus]WNS79527.1 hypothetical protein RRU94_18540 [Domibacillus sp. DTU_2020_1001157_1_SI_ALB_TIR_016]